MTNPPCPGGGVWSGNDIYLEVDGERIDWRFKTVGLEPTVETQDVTSGSGTTSRSRNEGLYDYTITIGIAYDEDRVGEQLPYIRPGRHYVVLGPQGNSPGKPKHAGWFIFTGAPFEVSVEKSPVAFEISGEQSCPPDFDMYGLTTGGVLGVFA